LPAANELARQFDALKGVTSSFAHITETLPAANELARQFDLAKATLSPLDDMTKALLPMSDIIRQLEPVKKAIPSLLNTSYLTEFQRTSSSISDMITSLRTELPTAFSFEDIYTHTYTSLYKDIDNIKFNENPNAIDSLCIDVIDNKKNIEYPLCNQKDVIGLADLFRTISKEEAIEFINFISQYPYLAYFHKTGQQILTELENLAVNALEEISDVVLYRGRLWVDNQGMDYTVGEMWQPPFGNPGMERFNPVGISYLYLSDSAQTAVSELKDTGRRYSIMESYLTRKTSILDISKQNCYIFELCHKQKTGNAANSKEYLIPNYIAQCCAFLEKGRKIEGIKYKSSMAENGYCYVLFNKYRDSFTNEKVIVLGGENICP
jgi:RES domain-containing protein